MEFSSLQVCMDSSDWLQGTMSEDGGFDSPSSPTSHDMLTCSRPLIERRLRPPRDQALKCPRCESTHTKFCYYNNYSLSQPRYFCKTCRRYWTKGGTLRNIPVGGGCRKNKKGSGSTSTAGTAAAASNSKKSSSISSVQSLSNDLQRDQQQQYPMINAILQSSMGLSSSMMTTSGNNNNNNSTELQLSFPHQHHDHQVNFSHFGNLMGVHGGLGGGGEIGFMESKYNALLEQNNNNNSNGCSNISSRPIDFLERYKLDALVGHQEGGSFRGHDFLGNGNGGGPSTVGGGFVNIMGGTGAGVNGTVDHLSSATAPHGFGGDYNGFCSPFGLTPMDHHHGDNTTSTDGVFLDHRLMLPAFDGNDHHHQDQAPPNISIDVKPNTTKLLSLQWQDQHQLGCSHDHEDHSNFNDAATKISSFGYNNNNSNLISGLSSWTSANMINGYGPSTTNPLV